MTLKIRKMHLATLTVCVVLGVVAMASASYAAANLDFMTYFPTFQGGNNLYMDGFVPGAGTYRELPKQAFTNQWFADASQIPLVGKLEADNVMFHPTLDESATLIFAAPSEGDYSYSLQFYCTPTYTGQVGATTRATIFVDDVNTGFLWSGLVNKNSSPTDIRTVHLKTSQILVISVDAQGNQDSDLTQMRQVATVPEPGSLGTLGMGLLASALGFIRRRKTS